MRYYRGLLLGLGAIAGVLPLMAADVTFEGMSDRVIKVDAEKSTGLDAIFVVSNIEGVSIVFHDPSASKATWYRYSNLGGGYAEEITSGISSSASDVSTLETAQGDMGYIIEYGDSRRYYFWVVDYSLHALEIEGLEPSDEQGCDETYLHLTATGTPIRYYSITGQQHVLDQQIEITYFNLEWDEESMMYLQVEETKNLASATAEVRIAPPVYCATPFTVEGDRFLKAWGRPQTARSRVLQPKAVNAVTFADQEDSYDPESETGSNVMHGDDSGLGGSAPAHISFKAYTTDAVIHHEWQLTIDPNFEAIDYRFNQQDLDYTFDEEGVFYMRYVGSNADGSCEVYGDVYTIKIGASDIKCPNAFTPGVSPGVNDEWKVSYRSITDFKCWIFNRYGTELFHFTDPNQGWDGRYKGKYVKPGVYYYVIEARGADGKHYKLSGDINIIGYKGLGTSGGGGSEEATPDDVIPEE